MINVSRAYKRAMNEPIRGRAYVSVSLGLINQSAQGNAHITSDLAVWSNGNVFDNGNNTINAYGTMEEDYIRADGNMLFMPESDQYLNNGAIAENIGDSVTISFDNEFHIRGLSIEFGEESYPTSFTITTDDATTPTHTYNNGAPTWSTEDIIGDVTYITITPLAMVGGNQRLRIKSFLCGVGLNFTNDLIENISINDYVSPTSTDGSYHNATVSVFDTEGKFDVDNTDSYMSFLEPMQNVKISFGIDLDDDTQEWKQVASLYLKDWKSARGKMEFTVTDKLEQLTEEYADSTRIYSRTAYDEFESILTSAGFESDEYDIDSFLSNVTITNPLPQGTYKDCLQTLASACRCVVYEDENGIVNVRGNFSTVLDPSDITVIADDASAWATPANVLYDYGEHYGEMSYNSIGADSNDFFMPEDLSTIIETKYVSSAIADANGDFVTNPKLTLQFPSTFSYYGVNIEFGDVVPNELVINTYRSGTLLNTYTYTTLSQETSIEENFLNFDKMEFIVSKTHANARVLINRVYYGTASDYRLVRDNMTRETIGTMEQRIKEIWVKIYTYVNDAEGVPQEIQDNKYCVKTLNASGKIVYYENPLISTQAQASLVGEWLSSYYLNNVEYDAEYRGDFRLQPTDIIGLETQFVSNLQVSILKHELAFDGSFSGSLALRRANPLSSLSTRYEDLPVTESDLSTRVSSLETEIDTKQDSATAITTSNIGSQHVAYADSAGSASTSWSDITGKPNFATVATSGSYNDLSNKPTIPTVNNATLTIQRNGSNVATFTANASNNATANISVPTNTNQLTNGAGFITSSGSCNYANSAGSATKATQDGSGNVITDKYVSVYNTTYIGSSSSVTVNDLANQGPAEAMIYSATDNPIGSSSWVHVWSQGWGKTNTSWVSQIALGTGVGTGMYYRCNSGSIVGRGWTRVIDSSNIGSQSVNYASSANYANSAGYSNSAGSASNANYATNSGRAQIIESDNGKSFMQCGNTPLSSSLIIQADYNLVLYKNGSAIWYTGTSSRRFKENINDITEERALKVLELRPVTFDYKDGVPVPTRQKDKVGFIAEEVLEVLPDVVINEPSDENPDEMIPRNVDYEGVVPYLTKLCQMQQKQIDEQQNQIDELKRQIEEIKQLLTK